MQNNQIFVTASVTRLGDSWNSLVMILLEKTPKYFPVIWAILKLGQKL